MGPFRTVGQPAAIAAVRAMLAGAAPHAVLIVGPPSVGKTTLALDLASGLLCTGAAGADRPCRACRACRMVEHGNHPDLHRLAPEGAGDQIRIGRREDPEPGTVRDLIGRLALLPVEGGARVAIVERAQRMNDDAQSALLKTLEEPPAATTIVLCADDDERLLPTVRSRCARVRLGTLGRRDVEALLAERAVADPPTAARVARVAGGRPGLALAYAASPEAVTARGELSRTLLDLLGARRSERLAAARGLVARASELSAHLAPPVGGEDAPPRRRGSKAAQPAAASGDDAPDEDAAVRVPAAERRRALAMLLDVWRDVARDLAVAGTGARSSLRDVDLLEELEAAAAELPPGAPAAMVARLARASELLEANVSPELLLDVLLLAWPRRRAAA